MARGKGKQSLKEILNESQLTQTDEETGTIPFWIIDDTMGVAVNQYEFSLVERKEMTRSIKDENGNITGGEIYYIWQFCKSASSFEDALITYCKVTERKLLAKLVKCKDFREIVKIRLQIQKTINDSFKIDGINKDLLSACNTIESHQELDVKIAETNKLIDDVIKQANDFIEFIKEKQTIIVNRTENKPKKHRIKEEE